MANLPIRRCLRCGQSTHTEENCPNSVEARTDHPDAWDHYENAPALEEDDGDNCILQNGNVIRQPGDGNCLRHTLSMRFIFFDIITTGPALRHELSQWLRNNRTEVDHTDKSFEY